jgi:multidrug resistance efflux pump
MSQPLPRSRGAADLTFAQQTYNRTKQLAVDQFAPRSKLDQDTDALTLAQKRLDQANLAYREAIAGITAEEHGIARANVAKAAAKIQSIKALADGQRPGRVAGLSNPRGGGGGRLFRSPAPVTG